MNTGKEFQEQDSNRILHRQIIKQRVTCSRLAVLILRVSILRTSGNRKDRKINTPAKFLRVQYNSSLLALSISILDRMFCTVSMGMGCLKVSMHRT